MLVADPVFTHGSNIALASFLSSRHPSSGKRPTGTPPSAATILKQFVHSESFGTRRTNLSGRLRIDTAIASVDTFIIEFEKSIR